uniref:Uncharacterized protein n=1 Tax=Ditylenchus dipsaci TaxID=166011 RepID=A0A915EJE2_9BILA
MLLLRQNRCGYKYFNCQNQFLERRKNRKEKIRIKEKIKKKQQNEQIQARTESANNSSSSKGDNNDTQDEHALSTKNLKLAEPKEDEDQKTTLDLFEVTKVLRAKLIENLYPSFIVYKCKKINDLELLEDNLAVLSEQILAHYDKEKQQPETFKLKEKLKNLIFQEIRTADEVFKESVLHMINTQVLLKDEIRKIQSEKFSLISKEEMEKKKEQQEELISASTPILKMVYDDIPVDLGVDSATSVRNTHLLLLYTKYDDRVAPLVSVVKEWAKRREINSAFKNSLSSYCWVLMVIHFLQSAYKASGSALSSRRATHEFGANVRDSKFYERLPVSCTTRLYFQLQTRCVRVKQNPVRTIKHHAPIYIEEPFTHLNAAFSVHYGILYFKIVQYFINSFEELYMNMDLDSF